MRAWRQAGTSTLRLLLGDPFGSRHLLKRLCKLAGVTDVEREAAPGARLGAHLAEGQALETGLDRQQQQRRRLVAAPAELDRAHRRAARSRRQDAPAGVGEEDRVDQLRLAARELGDEGDDELFVTKSLAQGGDLLGSLAVGEVVLIEKARERLRSFAQRGAPAAEGVETGGK
jgi:hypothetical protein